MGEPVEGAAAPKANPVYQLLKGLVEQPDLQIYYRGSVYALGAADCPHGATLAFVRAQLRELDKKVKAASAA